MARMQTAKAVEPLERDVMKEVIAALQMRNWYMLKDGQGIKEALALLRQPRQIRGVFWRCNTGLRVAEATQHHRRRVMRFGVPGMSDLIGVRRDGHFVAIEVKRPNGKPSEAQQDFLDLVHELDAYSLCATSAQDVLSAECL